MVPCFSFQSLLQDFVNFLYIPLYNLCSNARAVNVDDTYDRVNVQAF